MVTLFELQILIYSWHFFTFKLFFSKIPEFLVRNQNDAEDDWNVSETPAMDTQLFKIKFNISQIGRRMGETWHYFRPRIHSGVSDLPENASATTSVKTDEQRRKSTTSEVTWIYKLFQVSLIKVNLIPLL
jgi:hypothetical protein